MDTKHINKLCKELGIGAKIADGYEYINYKEKTMWENDNGEYFYRSWSSLRTHRDTRCNISDLGEVLDLRYERGKNTRKSYKQIKQYIESYGEINYKLLTTKKEYDQRLNRNKHGADLLKIGHLNFISPWITTISNFNNGAFTKFNSTPFGELLVESVLKGSHLKYERQVQIKDASGNNTLRTIDFLVIHQGKKYFIEYDGIQHHKSVSYYGGENELKNRLNRDKEKDEYVKNIHGARLIRIPYSVRTRQEVVCILEKYLGVSNMTFIEIGSIANDKEIADYYLTNTLEDTVNKFKFCDAYVAQRFKYFYGMNKKDYLINNPQIVQNISHREKYKMNKNREILFYYLVHEKEETCKKYKINELYLDKKIKRFFGYSKKELIGMFGSDVMNKILTKNIYYFCNKH